MTIHELLSKAEQRIIGEWQASQPTESEPLLRLWAEVNFFICRSGQVYRFEDYLKRPLTERTTGTAWSGAQGAQVNSVREILERMRDAQQSAAHRDLVQVGIDAIDYLAALGQQEEFYDYLKSYYPNPPPVIAHFNTRVEVEEWLNRLAEPPSSSYILIGDEYFEIYYDRDRGVRGVRRDHVLERFIEAVTSQGLPTVEATFATRSEVEAWWTQHPNPPISAWVQVAGEHHLAINHRKTAHRTLHPISLLKGWEEEKKRLEQRAKAQQAEDTPDTED